MVIVVRYRVLGPVAVEEGSEPVLVGGPRARAVLALLLADPGRVVTDRQLVHGLWGDNPPRDAHHAIQNHVSRLRRILSDDIVRDGGGYRLDIDPMAVDAHRFTSLVASGNERLADAPAAAAVLLREALSLWHGEPYADLRDVPGLQPDIRRLQVARVAAVEDRVKADLDAGAHVEVAAELEALIREHPFRERLYAMQMLALYRLGRQAEALDVYQHARRSLAEHLGIDPSPLLNEVHAQILAQDPKLQAHEGSTTADPGTVATQPDTGLPVISGFESREQVGDGDFGRTYRAYHASLGREVAIKIIHKELADLPSVIRGFERRAQRVAQLDHPHVVPLLDAWRSPGVVYLVTPWVAVGNVRRTLRHGPWTPAAALALIEQVGAALDAAHRRGIAHGDVKTANILLSDDGSARLADFTVAPRLRDPLGQPRTNDLGAIAPEERRGAAPSPAGDVHGLGAVAIEMLTGSPVPADTPAAALERHVGAVPRDMVDALAAATATDPALRPPRVGDLVRLLRRSLGADVVPPAGAVDAGDAAVRNPYKGLHAFTEGDAADFFGRESAAERLIRAIGEHPLAAVVGPSGSGKSSMVRAGVIPALRSGSLPGSERWLIADMYPGSHPFDELAVTLRRVAVDPPADLVAALAADERGLARVVKQILPGDNAELLLFVDQFEELFSLTTDSGVRRAFLESLVALAEDARGRVRTVLTLRADFFDRPLEHHPFGELLLTGMVSLTAPSRDELARAVSAPARQVGIEFESGLVARIVGDVIDQPGGLPLLQHALTELCGRRDGQMLTEQAYEDAGGVRGALGRRAEELYAGLPTLRQELARQIFLRLVTVDREAGATRRRVQRSELAELTTDRSAVDDVLQRFGAHRLLTFDRDPVSRGSTVEVAHEALLGEWGRLRRWIEDRHDDLLLHRRFAQDAAEWREAGQAADYLLTGDRLIRLLQFADATDLALDEGERAYLAASREHEATVRRQRRRQRRLVGVALGCAAVVVLALFAVGLVQSERAALQDRAQQAAVLASASRSAQARDLDLSLLLAREAVRVMHDVDEPPTSDALGALHEAVLAHRVVTTMDIHSFHVRFIDPAHLIVPSEGGQPPAILDIASGSQERTLEAGPPEIVDTAISADGSVYAESHLDAPTTIWDLDSGRVAHRIPAASPMQEWPALSPDGTVLAVVNKDPDDDEFPQSVSVYDIATGSERHRIPVPGDQGRMTISPDGRTLAVPSLSEPTVRLFDLENGQRTIVLEGPPGGGFSAGVAFHPDNDAVAVMTPPHLLVHDLPTGAVIHRLRSDVEDAWDVCYGDAGRVLVVTQLDDQITVYGAETGTRLVSLPAGGVFSSASCSQTTSQVAAGTGDSNRAHVWDFSIEGSSEVWSVPAPAAWDAVWAAESVVTAHHDDRLRRHEPHTGRTVTTDVALPAHPPLDVVVAGEQDRLATNTEDPENEALNGLVLRDAKTLEVVRRFPVDGGPVAVSGDGSRLLVNADESDRIMHVLDTADGTSVSTLEIPESSPVELTGDFLPNGQVAVHAWRTTRVFDMDTGEIVSKVCTEKIGYHVAVSVRAGLLAIGGRSGIQLFDVDRLSDLGGGDAPGTCGDERSHPGDEARVRLLPGANVSSMNFSPDGTQLASLSETGTVSLWEPRTGALLFKIAHEGKVGGGAFSNDGRHLAVTLDMPEDEEADAVRVYTLDTDELLDIAATKLTREFTLAECAGYGIAEPCGSQSTR